MKARRAEDKVDGKLGSKNSSQWLKVKSPPVNSLSGSQEISTAVPKFIPVEENVLRFVYTWQRTWVGK